MKSGCTGVIVVDGDYSSDYILGILNSKLCGHYLNAVRPPKLSNTFRYNTHNINRIPIIENTNLAVEALVREMVAHKEELDTQSERFRSLVTGEYELASWLQKLGLDPACPTRGVKAQSWLFTQWVAEP